MKKAASGNLLSRLQAIMGEMPGGERRVPLEASVLAVEERPAFSRQLVSFATEPGDRIQAYLLIPRWPRVTKKASNGQTPALLCLHQTTMLRKAEPAGLDGQKNLHYGAELAERGYVALCPDYSLGPSFAGCEGTLFDPYANGYASATMKGIWNHRAALDFLQAVPIVDSERLGVIGHSLGGHNAIFLAAFDERVTAIVSSCGFTTWAKNSADGRREGDISDWSHSGYMPRIRTAYACDAARMPFDFPDIISSFAPRAFFANAPIHDSFSADGVRDCLVAARPAYASIGAGQRLQAVYPDCAHDFPPSEREAAYLFIDRWL